jgi:F420H(2)-dependent biliverdin reductase
VPLTFSDELLEFWRERRLCSVATLRPDGSPHLVPMGITLDAEQRSAWGITSGASQKVVNLRRGTDPRVAVNQVEGRRWSTLEGVARVLDDEGSVAEAVRRYAERYRQPRVNPNWVAIEITVDNVLASPGLLDR